MDGDWGTHIGGDAGEGVKQGLPACCTDALNCKQSIKGDERMGFASPV